MLLQVVKFAFVFTTVYAGYHNPSEEGLTIILWSVKDKTYNYNYNPTKQPLTNHIHSLPSPRISPPTKGAFYAMKKRKRKTEKVLMIQHLRSAW